MFITIIEKWIFNEITSRRLLAFSDEKYCKSFLIFEAYYITSLKKTSSEKKKVIFKSLPKDK